jgi:hypothetical protein
MNQIDYIVDIIFRPEAQDKLIKNKKNLINGEWLLLNKEALNKHKNKTIIESIIKIEETASKNFLVAEYSPETIKYKIETKEYYGFLKYNINFIAYILCKQEYGLLLNEIQIIFVNINTLKNYKQNKLAPPLLKDILKIIGWKIRRKAIAELEPNNNINNY